MKRLVAIFVFILSITAAYAQMDTVNVGTTANSGDGEGIRTAFLKINRMIVDYNRLGLYGLMELPGGSIVYPDAGIVVSSGFGWGTSIINNSTNWNTAYTERLRWNGGATGLNAATGRTSLGATTVGSNLFTLPNPGAIRFLRLNADNSVSALDAAAFLSAIGGGSGGGDITKVDTPSDNQLAVWTGDGTLEGESDVTYNSSTHRFELNGQLWVNDSYSIHTDSIYHDNGTGVTVEAFNINNNVINVPTGGDYRINGVSIVGAGTGDMLQSVYDTDENNVVDEAETAATVTGLSLGSGSLATVGDDALTFTTIGTTGVTLPESGTLATLQNINDSINARIGDGLNLSDIAVLKSDSTGGPGHYASWHDMNTGLNGKEDALGNPGVNGYVLSSTTEGVRTWIENGSGGSMVYPSGSGIPIVSSGASWGTTITDNSTNWNSAYSWGNHASAGYEPGLGNPASDGYVLTSTAAGVRSWAASSGTVTIEDVSGVVGDSLDAIRAASVQGLTLGDSSLYVTQTALNTAIAGVETGAVDSSLYVTVTRLTDSLNVIRTSIAGLVSTLNSAGLLVTSINVASLSEATTIDTDGGSLDFEADVSPNTALDTTLTWSYIAGTGTATFETEVGAPTLTALTNGTVTVRATANDGSGIYGEVQITISNQVGTIAMSTAELGTYNDSIIATTWDRNLHQDSVPPVSAFSVTEDGNTFGIEAITINEDSLFIALDSTGAYGSTYLLSYTPGFPAIQDSSENNAVAFSGQAVTNNISAPGAEPPTALNTDTFGWFIADADNFTITNDSISQWDDLSGEDNHITAVADHRPYFNSETGEVMFLGTGQEINATISSYSQPITVYAVMEVDTYVAFQNILVLSVTQYMRLSTNNANNYKINGTDGANFNTASSSLIEDTYIVARIVFNGTETDGSKFQINEETATTGTLAANTTETIRLGGPGNSGFVFNIKELIIRNTLDSEATQSSIVGYLNGKYNVYE